MQNTVLIKSSELRDQFERILVVSGFSMEKAVRCADIFTANTLEGVFSHGVNRFPRFVDNIRNGFIKPDEVPVLVHSAGALEQWDGKLGPGPLNAIFATDRAVEISGNSGIGLVALANTNHWMRGGTYGWHAAKKGYIFIGWTNTEANMPAWGACDARLGNNPMILAVPFEKEAIVLDFAMTQFSYGKMEAYRLSGEKLPFHGGFDKKGVLTDDPGEILETRRPLPIGYWKGAGLSLLLEVLAVVLSGGRTVGEISASGTEHSLSQVFIVIDTSFLHNNSEIGSSISKIISYHRNSVSSDGKTGVRYPGQNITALREKHIKEGIPVNREIWETIINL